MTSAQGVTRLLQRAGDGDSQAADQLVPLIYDRLRQIARQQLRRQAGNTMMSTTVLVHEAWLTLLAEQSQALSFDDRSHFFRYAARAMRNILIDQVRAGQAAKRGGGAVHMGLNDLTAGVESLPHEELLALDAALDRLFVINPRLGEVVQLRFFAGLEVSEVAQVLAVAERTIVRDWRKARLLLQGLLDDQAGSIDEQ